ncbi:MAG: UDP-2,3-diacylglucosamine hydrolase [Gemmatimonadota bacterium]|nr:MAG: UDP-2,3-diacylglucosamine hydrolase [Gemmatimonadota bacterium]
MAGPVYFISDAHLGSSADPATDAPRLERLIPFLHAVRDRRAEHLYIVGDLFDFWFEYTHVMPWRHARILGEIRAVVDAGVPVTFLGGNHDWWAGPVFEEFAGMTVHRDALTVEHQGRRVFLHHGDGLASQGDSGYMVLKAVLRNRVVIRLLRLVHPDLAYSLGHRLSRFSRQHLTGSAFRLAPAVAAYVDQRLAEGHDAVAMGHLHTRYAERRPDGRLFILGDWMTIFSALRLEGGEFTWEDWSSGAGVDVPEMAPPAYGGHGDEVKATDPGSV